MAKNYLIKNDSGLVAVSGDGKDAGITISDKDSDSGELMKLLSERKNLGIQISRYLKKHGLVSASDDEDTVVG